MAWLLALFAGMAFAQPSPAGPAVNGSPQVPDAIAQRVQTCTPCHSREGRATNEGVFPRIAGKPAGYFYNQLVHFREGRRRYAAMTYLVEHLSDDYLRDIAQYFAALELRCPPPALRDAAPAALRRAGGPPRRAARSAGQPGAG